MSKKSRAAHIKIPFALHAAEMEQLRDAITEYYSDIMELDAACPSMRFRSVLFSALSKLRDMTFSDAQDDEFPLSQHELIAGATAINYVLWLYDRKIVDPGEMPESLQDEHSLTALSRYLSKHASLLNESLLTSFD